MPGAFPTKVRPLRGRDDFRRSVVISKLGERRRAKPACAAGLGERGFYGGRDVLRRFELWVMADIVQRDDA
jgi:hypothetical protein